MLLFQSSHEQLSIEEGHLCAHSCAIYLAVDAVSERKVIPSGDKLCEGNWKVGGLQNKTYSCQVISILVYRKVIIRI